MYRTLSGAGLAALAARHHAREIPRFVLGEMQLLHRVCEASGSGGSFQGGTGESQLGRLLHWAGKDLGLRKGVGARVRRGLRGADVERCLRFTDASLRRRRGRLGGCLSGGCRRFGCEGVVSFNPVFNCQQSFICSSKLCKLTFPFPREESYNGTPLCGQARLS